MAAAVETVESMGWWVNAEDEEIVAARARARPGIGAGVEAEAEAEMEAEAEAEVKAEVEAEADSEAAEKGARGGDSKPGLREGTREVEVDGWAKERERTCEYGCLSTVGSVVVVPPIDWDWVG